MIPAWTPANLPPLIPPVEVLMIVKFDDGEYETFTGSYTGEKGTEWEVYDLSREAFETLNPCVIRWMPRKSILELPGGINDAKY